MEKIVDANDLESIQENSPFLIFIPDEIPIAKPTYRVPDEKWATLRFECSLGGERLRVKEFFLDWFYPGFPKSLMDSFISTYSAVESSTLRDRVIFYGKNYKGKEASSSFCMGTQIEIEGESRKNVVKLSEMMTAPFVGEKFRRYPFFKRSFFANGGKPEWFEEARISNLSWGALEREIWGGSLLSDSLGIYRDAGRIVQMILVLSEDYYKRAAWVDITNKESRRPHLVYEFRKGGNFFDVFEETDVALAFRGDAGPTIARSDLGNFVATVSLTPLFKLQDARSTVKSLIEGVRELETFI